MSLVALAVGLDLSLTAAGVATFEAYDDGPPIGTTRTFGRKGKADESLSMRRERIDTQVTDVFGAFLDLERLPDVALIEAPAPGQTTGSHHDRSWLWGKVVDMLDNFGIPTIEVTPQKVKKYATGKGNAGKAAVMAAMIRRHLNVEIADDNQSDALALAAMGARLLGHPVDSPSAACLDAMNGVTMP